MQDCQDRKSGLDCFADGPPGDKQVHCQHRSDLEGSGVGDGTARKGTQNWITFVFDQEEKWFQLKVLCCAVHYLDCNQTMANLRSSCCAGQKKGRRELAPVTAGC